MSDIADGVSSPGQAGVEDVALRKILEGTVAHTGNEFFRALVKSLAEVLGTESAWVTEYLPERGKLRAIAFWMEDHYIDDYEFDIPGTPCERVVREKQLFHIPDNIIELYPHDPDLRARKAASYLGAPLLDLDGTILGHLAVLHTRPMPEEARNVALFKIFADRAASEMRRLNAENQLRKRTEELQKEHSRKSAELADARNMQLRMLPQTVPCIRNYQFSFSMKAASEVGGDYYDYHMADDGTLTFGIGDATGHGMQAGVMVTAMKLLFTEHAAGSDIVAFLERASRSLSLMDFRKLYMAFAIGRLAGDTLELAGAGMPPAFVYRAADNTLEQIPLKGMPLGSNAAYPYASVQTDIGRGDQVILMTDGMPELFNGQGDMLGYDRLSELIMECIHQSPEGIINHFHATALHWLDGSDQNDDMTFFVFKRI